MRRWWVLLTVTSLCLAACGRPQTPAAEPTTPPAITATKTALPAASFTPVPTATPSTTPSPTSTRPHASTAAPTTASTPSPVLSLGEPSYLGRGQIMDAVFAPDAVAVAVGWANGVSLWDVTGGTERWWQPTGAPVIALDVHPRGEAVVAALADGSLFIVDAASGRAQRREGAPPHAYWGDVAWSPDGRQIAFQFIGSLRGDPIYLFDVASGTLGEVPASRLDPGTQPFLAWSPDGRAITLASLGGDCSKIIDVQTGQVVLTLQAGEACAAPHDMAWSPDGKQIAVGAALIDARSGQAIHPLQGRETGFVFPQPGWSIRFSPDGAHVAAGGQVVAPNRLLPIAVWDATTGEMVAQMGPDDAAYDPALNRARVALAFDGQSLMALYEDGELVRWAFGDDASPTRTTLVRMPVVAAQPPLAWSADGRRFAAGNRYGGAAVWDVDTARQVAAFESPLGTPALSPDGRLLALIDRAQGQVLVVDLDRGQGEEIGILPRAETMPMGAAFSADGSLIAYGLGDLAVVADVASGQTVALLAGHPAEQVVSRVIWSPDSRAFVTASSRPSNDETPGVLILWQRREDGSFAEAYRTETVRAGYDCCVLLACFSSAGTLVAMESLPMNEASQFRAIVYDLQAHQEVLALQEYELAGWVSDDVLLTSEAEYVTRLTRWDVRTGKSTAGRGWQNGNVYAPGALFYARPNEQSPYAGRGIEIHDWDTGRIVARSIYDGDVMRILWSVEGRQVGALTATGLIVIWRVQNQ